MLLTSLATCTDRGPSGCLTESDTACVPPPPCAALAWSCNTPGVTVTQIATQGQRAPGLRALGAVGDYVMTNGFLSVVIDAPDHPNALAPSGGTILDMAPRNGGDQLNQIYQITGILPRDAVRYRSAEVLTSMTSVSVVVRGALDGDPAVRVVTRYELRSCDRGLRVRTEVYNGGDTTQTYFLADANYYGDRGMTPFAPGVGEGFRHPELDLVEIDTSWRTFPWMAAQSHTEPFVGYAEVACDRPMLEGVNDANISAVGLPRTIVRPGDGLAFERMIFVAPGPGLDGAAALALDAHARLNEESTATVTGRVVRGANIPTGLDERAISLLLYEPGPNGSDDPARITPWTEVVPDADGTFSVPLLSGRRYRAQPYRLGRAVGSPVAIDLTRAVETNLGDIVLSAPARLQVLVGDAATRAPLMSEIVLVPVEGMTRRDDVTGSVNGFFGGVCAPYLGPPDGASPACNRVLLQNGTSTFDVPPGTYWVYAHAGMERQLARQQVTLAPGGSAQVSFALAPITGLFPAGSLTGDFHVHGGRSFDTAFPDRERVMSFVIAGVQVIAATDHDVTTSYQESIASLNVGARVRVMPGVETTQLIPWMHVPGSSFPKDIGHFNFWPLTYDTTRSHNGAPWDELIEPGQLFDIMRREVGATGVMQLNHPTSESKIGRDEGYLRALGYDPRRALPGRDDGTGPGRLYARPNGAQHRNIDYDVQEAMNGAELLENLQYRTVWHQFLSQGVLRAGTANSDSHSMRIGPMGYPRNVVLAGFGLADFDVDAFNTAVRDGRMVGTNGPVVTARLRDGDARTDPGVRPVTPGAGAEIEVEVRSPPWVPVTEVRVVVNGRVARTIPVPADPSVDPFGSAVALRYQGAVSVSELLQGRDGWVVIEAGLPLPRAVDTDDDGLVDQLDGDGDGQTNDRAPTPAREADPRFHVDVISPGTWPMGFTNPFVIDADGGGWRAPGL